MSAEDRVLTLPNLVSSIRLALIPVFVILVAQPDRAHWWAAAWLLAGLGATDFVDGQLARRLGQVSTVGKVLDPLADRVLVGVAIVTLLVVGALPLWVGLVAVAKEVTVSLGFLMVGALGVRRMDVSLVGKAGTFLMMVAFPAFLAGRSTSPLHHGFLVTAWCFAIPGMVVSWLAVAGYVPKAREALKKSQAHHETSGADSGMFGA